ncbi:MAG: hypothetical protein FJ118_14345 [Deltaproteobacteria bacterium]|nr:hypothetical protein [Deltaproteobacteria bacterium]
MVKRTLAVLGIMSLVLMAAGTSHAFLFGGGCGDGVDCGISKPLYVPVDCPPYPKSKTIVKKWEMKIVGPCPAPMPACGPAKFAGDCKMGLFGGLCAAIPTPLDWLFGGFDGVYGCGVGLFGGSGDGECGPWYGPFPAALAAVPMGLGYPTTVFGGLW